MGKKKVYRTSNCSVKAALNLAQCTNQTNIGLTQHTTLAWKTSSFIIGGVMYGGADDEMVCHFNWIANKQQDCLSQGHTPKQCAYFVASEWPGFLPGHIFHHSEAPDTTSAHPLRFLDTGCSKLVHTNSSTPFVFLYYNHETTL
jgi:hypothetical protein